ncbi:ANTAR domain-containing protein [Streptomyces sp. NPDC059009]|uniref:ANTAR domain-containing protein n=1 Tax=Streptomyces sp. NPDC059009 TaxID=3346694 RepID=UPI00369EA6BD
MPAPDEGPEPSEAATPGDPFADLLTRARRAARTGLGLDAAPLAGAARLIGLDALTASAAAHDGHLELLWSDPPQGLGPDLDDLQYVLGEGPTLEAVHQSHSVLVPDLTSTDPTRWPTFLTAVVGGTDVAVRGVVAAPLELGAATVGVLTGYGTTPTPLSGGQLQDFHSLGRVLLLLLLHQTAPPAEHNHGDMVDGIRLYRAEVHQATGFVAHLLGIPLDQALTRLRTHAATHDRPLSELVHAVLTRHLSPEDLGP